MYIGQSTQEIWILKKTLQIPHSTRHASKGEIVVVVSGDDQEKTVALFLNRNQLLSCPSKYLHPIPAEWTDLLLAIMPPSKRLDMLQSLDRRISNIQIGDHITVQISHIGPPVQGEVKYRGVVEGRVGTWFGVHLTQLLGNSDGSLEGRFYMGKCQKNSVIFTSIDNLSLPEDTLSMLSNLGTDKKQKKSKTLPIRRGYKTCNNNSSGSAFNEGDSVILLHSKTPAEPGVVRCVFQDAKKGRMLGIELERPVGDSSGTYKGTHMFTCPPKHGIFCDTSEAVPKYLYETPPGDSEEGYSGAANPSYSEARAEYNSYTGPTGTLTGGSATLTNNHSSNSNHERSDSNDFENAFKQNGSIISKLGALPSDMMNSINTLTLGPDRGESRDTPAYTSPTPSYTGPPPPYQTSTPSYHTLPSHTLPAHSLPSHSRSLSADITQDKMKVEDQGPGESPGDPLEVGSMVQVEHQSVVYYGVLRWVGNLPAKKWTCAGLELEEEINPHGNDGMYQGVRYFTCPAQRALFCYLHDCKTDRRFEEMPEPVAPYYGPYISGVVIGPPAPPPVSLSPEFIGRGRGVQGNKNSCYLDATLFAMFAFSDSMDRLLSSEVEGELNKTIQTHLREHIVSPLRDRGFVGASAMMLLRDMLSRASSLGGLQDEEKEPEELLNVLFNEVFAIDPLLSLRDGNTGHLSKVNLCQILVEREPHCTMPTTQQLLTKCFVSQNLSFDRQPDVLLLQVPRSGKDFKLYDTVIPSPELELGGLCGGVWGNCFMCNDTPKLKCAKCYMSGDFKSKVSATPLCERCSDIIHAHPDRGDHVPSPATTPIRGIKMKLSSVLCINTSHYVAYSHIPSHPPAWVFFDSMADREGGVGGYNIPQVEECPEMCEWLNTPLEHDQHKAPLFVKRLIKDALLCFYIRE